MHFITLHNKVSQNRCETFLISRPLDGKTEPVSVSVDTIIGVNILY